MLDNLAEYSEYFAELNEKIKDAIDFIKDALPSLLEQANKRFG